MASISSCDVNENIGIDLQYHSSFYHGGFAEPGRYMDHKGFEFLTNALIAATVQKREFGKCCIVDFIS